MEVKKCSSKKHEENNAIFYCPECKIYMCNKCENYHSELFQSHHLYKLDKDIKLIFTGFCKEENHYEKLEYFCKNHNILCCDSCITKIKKNGKGQHTDCDVCILNDIKEEKKNKLKDNIKCLEELSKTLEESINKLKLLFEKMNEKKENLKLKIQKIFTNIRNAINEREDFLLLEVDKKFDKIFLNENIIKQSENLPNKIKLSLEKGKIIDKEWNDENKLNSLINDCINIENNIKEINIIDNNIKKSNNSETLEIFFHPEEDNLINEFIGTIKSFGFINNYSNIFQNSVILSSQDKYWFIIKEIEKRNNKIKNSKLIYKAKRDGDTIDNFFNKCNGIKDIVLLIKSDNNCRFGGFTLVGFQKSSDNKYKDNSAFVFSLDKRKIYPIIKGKDAIRCCGCCCPQFCQSTIYLNPNFLTNKSCYVNSKNENYEGFTMDYELNNGNQYFSALELEVHQIFFL